MANRLIWGILAGVVLGSSFGPLIGNTAIAIAACIALGVMAAGIWNFIETRE